MMDDNCPACGYRIDDYDLEGCEIRNADNRLYTRLNCPHCDEPLAYVLDYAGDSGAVHECTWEARPCGYRECPHCLGSDREEYNERHAVSCDECGYHLADEDEWEIAEPHEDEKGTEWQGIHCPECGSKERSKLAN